MLTAWSAFTGGGLADIGLQDAGLKLVGGLELEPKIATIANINLGANHVEVADITEADPADFPYAHWGHFSPECKRASQANTKGGESELDLRLADAIINFIMHHRYQVVSIENVIPYQHFRSFKNIVSALTILGYGVKWWRLNAADYGVPQTRKRLFLVARLDGEPKKPKQTHMKYKPPPPGTLFNLNNANPLPRWRGWYEAIEDLVPSLPVGKLAPWQVRKLKDKTLASGTQLINDQNASGLYFTFPDSPSFTLALGKGNHGKILVMGQTRTTFNPSFKPSPTLSTKGGGRCKVVYDGQVLELTPRCLARFQTLPDSYILQGSKTLQQKIIGNGVPCLLMEKIAKANIDR